MPARILDGAGLAKTIRSELTARVAAVTASLGRPPGLGIVLVGEDPASEVYVRNKLRAAAEIGVRADLERLPATATIGDTLALVERLNRSPAHDGILELLDRERIPLCGARAVVIGRSDIVGKPMALLLMHRDATVTICHSKTRDLAAVAASADLLVAAVGRAAFITRAFVRPGATV